MKDYYDELDKCRIKYGEGDERATEADEAGRKMLFNAYSLASSALSSVTRAQLELAELSEVSPSCYWGKESVGRAIDAITGMRIMIADRERDLRKKIEDRGHNPAPSSYPVRRV